MKKPPRFLVFVITAAVLWVIVDIARIEMKRQGELVALCTLVPRLGGKSPKLSAASPSAHAAVKWIARTVGVAPNFELFSGSPVPGTAYAAFRKNKRVIVFDADKIRWGTNAATWAQIGVASHEIGHHLGGHTFARIGNAHERELEADRFAGYAMALLGASLAQALSFSNELAEDSSASHPARRIRITAITEGWRRGQVVRNSGTYVRESVNTLQSPQEPSP